MHWYLYLSKGSEYSGASTYTIHMCCLWISQTHKQLLYWSFDNLYSHQARELGSVKAKAQLLFCWVHSVHRRTRWKKRWLLLIRSLMRHYEMFSFLWRFVLRARQVALHRQRDIMNEWTHYQYKKVLKYLVKTDFYLQGVMYLLLCEVRSELCLLEKYIKIPFPAHVASKVAQVTKMYFITKHVLLDNTDKISMLP